MNTLDRIRRGLMLLALLSPALATAQTLGDGPRTYWHGLAGTQALTFFKIDGTANSNPADPSHPVFPALTAQFEADINMLGYSIMLPVAGRSATASLLLPAGSVSGAITSGPLAGTSQSSRGFGDPMVQLAVNLVGAPAIMSLKDMLRYEPKFTVDLMASVALPIGEHDEDKLVNLGQDRWYGRLGLPMVWFLGGYVPGEIDTIELTPIFWIFADKDVNGVTTSTDPLLQLEAHYTHDFTEAIWASVDAMSLRGGTSETGGVEGESLGSFGGGFTFGAKVSENVMLNASYVSTFGDEEADELSGDEFRLTLIYGWHPLIEGMHRLGKH